MSPQVAHRAALQVVLHGMNERAVNTFAALFASAAWKDCALAGTAPPDLGIVDLDTPTPEKTWADYRRRHPDLPTVVLSIREQSRDNARLLRKPVSATTLRTTIDQMRVEIERRRVSTPLATPATRPAPAAARPVAATPSTPRRPPPPPTPTRPPSAGSTTTPPAGRAPGAGTMLAPRPGNPAESSAAVAGPAITPAAVAKKAKTHAPFAPRRESEPRTATREVTRQLDPERAEEYCGDAPDIPIHDLAGLARIVYDPRAYFQGALERAIAAARRTRQAHVIIGLPSSLVVMPGRSGQVLTGLPPDRLRALCSGTIESGRLSVALATSAHLEEVGNATPLRDEALLWQVALWSGRGRLRRSIAIDTPVQLVQWPNFTRLVETPEAMRIAALLALGATTPMAAAARLRVPQRYVFAFVSAARAIGLIERTALDASALGGDTITQLGDGPRSTPSAPRQVRPAAAPAPKTGKDVAPRPLIARILARLLPGR